jgi:hypothetical protein
MKTLRMLYHLTRADLLERIRRNSFLIVLAITGCGCYLFVPPLDANYVTLAMGTTRGIYNSHWVGTMFGFFAAMFLPLFGFYLIKNTINHDRQTRVGQIIATTPISKGMYVLGKWLGNLAVLTLILVVLAVMALAMQLYRAEDLTIRIWDLILPVFLMGIPILSVVSALALLFESIPFLRGGFGNVVYFFLWAFATSYFLENMPADGAGFIIPVNDIYGITSPIASMQQQMIALGIPYTGRYHMVKGDVVLTEANTFLWEGLDWNLTLLLKRLVWVGIAMLVTLVAAIPFDRFDTSRDKTNKRSVIRGFFTRPFLKVSQIASRPIRTVGKIIRIPLSPLTKIITSTRFGMILVAELRLALKGQPIWWYTGMGLFIILGWTNPTDAAIRNIYPFAWLWPILVWSSLGIREVKHFTGQIVFSAAYPLRRQLPASWLAGVIVALLAGFGVAMNMWGAGEYAHLCGLLVGALFIPALALALGVWSGTNRLFEIIYLIWWYFAINGEAAIDFMGMTDEAIIRGNPQTFFLLTIGLLLIAVYGRKRKIQRG